MNDITRHRRASHAAHFTLCGALCSAACASGTLQHSITVDEKSHHAKQLTDR
jgi:hypothetical protein